jgi:hypothetical protein
MKKLEEKILLTIEFSVDFYEEKRKICNSEQTEIVSTIRTEELLN